jgi:predicted DNA-binding antitoxin AbrB/MazE fold protein
MPITVDATYEDGVLKPAQPLPLQPLQKVRITVHPDPSPILQAYGIMGWTGDARTLERFAVDPEFDPQEDE